MHKYLWILAFFTNVALASQPLRVVGTGATFEDAKTIAFREAVQHACKNTVFTRRESISDRITVDSIKVANGCNIHNYVLVESTVVSKSYVLTYDIWISETDLSNGLKSNHNNPVAFNGLLHKDQLNSYEDSVESYKRLVDEVFSVYPEHAFNIVQGTYTLTKNNFNEIIFTIPYQVSWNRNFIDSVHSLLENTGGKGSLFKNGNANVVIMPRDDTPVLSVMVSNNRTHYLYNETHVMDRIRYNMSYDKYAFIKIKFLDRRGNVLQSYCQDINSKLYTFEHTGFAHFFYKQVENRSFKIPLNVPVESIYEFAINPAKSAECNN